IKLRFKDKLSSYGLGLGDIKLGAVFFGLVVLITLPLFFFGARSPAMWAEYPLIYQGMDTAQIKEVFTWPSFLTYELIYGSFFFVIEFTFRAYMLFGLEQQFGRYTVLIQMLSYTAWHLPKPTAELLGTPVFGFTVAAVTLRLRSVWYVFLAHWLLNIIIDILILWNRGVI
ncbi:MAG TPA: CPBP family intramembrane glutamic endopeptidase, partial [Blastocatellia bacterium]|nr:CPBP family intramembrane glutamic endopeptidase [Blastocatellia bacterium]